MTNKCDNCLHNNVCKYKEKYLKAVKDFQDWQGIKSLYEYPVKIEINCYQFKDDELSRISTPMTIGGITPLQTPISCEGCPIYEDIKKGKTTINDACTFCSKSLLKVGD